MTLTVSISILSRPRKQTDTYTYILGEIKLVPQVIYLQIQYIGYYWCEHEKCHNIKNIYYGDYAVLVLQVYTL